MNKDVIYIDVDDDVTAIIGKIKKSKEKIVAVVPPKRAGALQSAVNLRLLDRMAKTAKKSLVLVTNNQALMALAANASIPVAKNLQSKPEIAEIPALTVDNDDDIIDGAQIPVGEHAKSAKTKDSSRSSSRSDAIESVDLDDTDDEDIIMPAAGVSAGAAISKKATSSKSRIKIPNFDSFRKKLFFGIGGGLLLVALLVWMFVFAPAATVVVKAGTTPTPVSANVKLGGTAATDYAAGVVQSVSQQEKKDETVEFEATGTGKVGDKSTGRVTFRNYEAPTPITINAGTVLSNGGKTYVTLSSVTVPPAQFATEGVSSEVQIQAQEVGSESDRGSGTIFSVAGRRGPSETYYFRAVASTAISGGTSREVKVVSADDIERAKGQLVGQSTDEMKQTLIDKFTNEEMVIDSSFTVERAEVVSVPAVNEEAPATGKARLTISTTYTIYAVPDASLKAYLDEALKAQIGDREDRQVYGDILDGASLSNFRKEGDVMTASLTATGQIGPKVDPEKIKEQVKGKIYGDAQRILESIEGIEEVDVKFSFFWVRSIPNDLNKIQVEFSQIDE